MSASRDIHESQGSETGRSASRSSDLPVSGQRHPMPYGDCVRCGHGLALHGGYPNIDGACAVCDCGHADVSGWHQ